MHTTDTSIMTQYVTETKTDGFRDPGCSQPHFSPSEYVSYAPTLSPYNVSSAGDPGLPTPTSGSNSPSLALPLRGQKQRMAPYPSPQQHPPSPPTASGMYWGHPAYHGLPTGGPQASSPGAMHPHVSEAPIDMTAYVTEDLVHPGPYVHGVSTAPTTPEMSFPTAYPSMEEVNAHNLAHSTLPTLGNSPHLVSGPMFDSFVLQPAPSGLNGPDRAPRRTPRKTPAKRAPRGRSSGAASSSNSGTAGTRNNPTMKRERMKLKPGTPKEAETLINLRYKHEGEKGRGMWNSISEEFGKIHNIKEKSSLQMMVNRAMLKHIEWPEEEDKALMAAVKKVDDTYWDIVKTVMKKDFGGCHSWEWKVKNLEKRAIELGLADIDEDDSKKARRRRKEIRRSSEMKANNAWPLEATRNHAPGTDAMMADPFPRADLTDEREDELIEKLMARPDADTDDGTDDRGNTMTDLREPHEDIYQHQHQSEPVDFTPHQDYSQRVALQACEELIQQRLV